MKHIGNKDIMRLQKTAFLASGTMPADEVLKVYDWASAMRSRGECVVSGFSSKLEQDVLHFLLKGNQPIIMVLARQMYKAVPAALQEAVSQGRLLIISVSEAVRQSKATAFARNRYICQMADSIYMVGVKAESSLYPLQNEYNTKLLH
ncbi:MAG: hypothetical protein J6Y82_04515 [Bacteroidales bacterium]|nr:hypothetical protein [Bacteroidales bacterium]